MSGNHRPPIEQFCSRVPLGGILDRRLYLKEPVYLDTAKEYLDAKDPLVLDALTMNAHPTVESDDTVKVTVRFSRRLPVLKVHIVGVSTTPPHEKINWREGDFSARGIEYSTSGGFPQHYEITTVKGTTHIRSLGITDQS